MAIDKHLQLLRNGVAKNSKAEAISALNTILVDTNHKPGEPALGIYTESGQTYAVLGINISGKTQIIEGVEATQKAIDIALANAKAYTNAEIAARKAVDGQTGQTYAKHTGANYISEATSLDDADVKLDKAVKANADAIAAETTARTAADTALDTRLTKAEALLGEVGDASTKETAFGKIQKNADAIAKLNGDSATTGSVANSIQTAINALDVNAIGGDGKVITTVSEQDGKIAATAIDLTAGNVKATATEATIEKVAVEGTNVAEQIASLAKSIKTTVADAKSYSIATVSGDELNALGTNVKEAYKLVDEDGAKAGEIIKIYKDSSLKSVELDDQTLNFTYILETGAESTVGVDVSAFLAESEFKDGLEVVDHVVKVKKDASSEGFLTVGAAGVKLSGVQDAINKAATEVVEDAAGHVTVTKGTGANGQAVYTIGENDIASDAALTAEVNRAKAAEDAIEAAVGLNADGSHVTTSGHYTSGATTIAGEIAALDAQVFANTNAIATEKSRAEGEEAKISGLLGTADDAAGTETAFGKIKTNAKAIETLNGTSAETGSVAKAIADLKSALIGGATAQTFNELETAIDSVKNAAISVSAGTGIEITGTGTTKTIAVNVDERSIIVDSEGVKVNLVSNGPIVLDGANGLTLGTWDLGNY